MRKRLPLAYALLVLTYAYATLAGPARQPTFIIDNVTLIDGTGKPARQHMTVTVRAGRIESVAPSEGRHGRKRDSHLIDGTNRFLIPGLSDSHVHLVDIGEVAIPLLVTYGITSVRDMGGDIARLRDWRSRAENGQLIAPRIKFCGPMLEGQWDPSSVGGRTDHRVVKSPNEARAVVQELADAGVDCIKIRSYASPETYFALAAAARAHGVPLVGHAPWGIDPVESSNAGQRSYDHAFYPWPWNDVTPQKKAEIERTFRLNGSLIVPTLIAWETFRLSPDVYAAVVDDHEAKSDPRLRFVSPSLRKNWAFGVNDLKSMNAGSPGWNKAINDVYEQVAEMHEHGVGMMAGTDTGAPMVYPGSALHQELELLVRKCRFTPNDALLTATLIPAKFFGMEKTVGTIAPNKVADLVLLSGNPLEDIANVRKIEGVMLNGRWLDRPALDRIASNVAKQIAEANQTH